MNKNQIDFKGKKVAVTFGFTTYLKEQIVKAGGIILGEDDYYKDIDILILNLGDIGFDTAMFLQYTQVEFYFLEEVIDSLGGDELYYQIKDPKTKEIYFRNNLFRAASGDFKGIENKLISEIRKAIADPNQVVSNCTLRRETFKKSDFKNNPNYKIGDEIPFELYKHTPSSLMDLYKSVTRFFIISTSISNPKLKVRKSGVPGIVFDYYIGGDELEDISFVDRILRLPSQNELFQEYNKTFALEDFDEYDANELGVKRENTYFLYHDKFTRYYPILLNVLDNGSFLQLNGDDNGASFETDGIE